MKRNLSIAMFGAVIVAVAGIGISGITVPSSEQQSSNVSEGQHILGHATMTVYDKDGNIKAYRQTDNSVQNVGDDCVTNKIFGVVSTLCNTTTAGLGNSKYVAIGTGAGHSSANRGLTALDSEQTTGFSTPATGDKITTTPTITQTAASSGEITQLVATFVTNAGMTVQEAGVFDTSGTSTGNMFARQTFTSTQLLSGDTLVVTWNITVN